MIKELFELCLDSPKRAKKRKEKQRERRKTKGKTKGKRKTPKEIRERQKERGIREKEQEKGRPKKLRKSHGTCQLYCHLNSIRRRVADLLRFAQGFDARIDEEG